MTLSFQFYPRSTEFLNLVPFSKSFVTFNSIQDQLYKKGYVVTGDSSFFQFYPRSTLVSAVGLTSVELTFNSIQDQLNPLTIRGFIPFGTFQFYPRSTGCIMNRPCNSCPFFQFYPRSTEITLAFNWWEAAGFQFYPRSTAGRRSDTGRSYDLSILSKINRTGSLVRKDCSSWTFNSIQDQLSRTPHPLGRGLLQTFNSIQDQHYYDDECDYSDPNILSILSKINSCSNCFVLLLFIILSILSKINTSL